MTVGEGGQRGDDLGRLAVSLEAFLGGRPFGGEPFGLARLVEHRAPLREGRVRLDAPLAGARQGVPVALELRERRLPLLERRSRLAQARPRRP